MAFFGERTYDPATDRLFLAYYALPADLVNRNQWGVSSQTIANNITSFRNRPLVLKRKDYNNPKDIQQAGSFVHPYAPQHSASLKEQLEHQNVYTVGKILDVKYNPQKGWKFETEVTDPLVKEALKNNDDKQAPQWVSPLIAETQPNQDPKNLMHWAGLHVAFVDVPAFGFELMKPAVICSGSMEECTVKLHNASEQLEQCGFCPKDAMAQLLSASGYSSLSSQNDSSNSLLTMSSINDTGSGSHERQQPQDFKVTTTSNTLPVSHTEYTVKASEQTPKIEGDPNDASKVTKSPSEGEEGQSRKAKDPDTPLNADLPKSYEEAIAALKQRDAVIENLTAQTNDFKKNLVDVNKFVAEVKKKERLATLKTMIPRQLFKSEDKYNAELEKVYNWQNIDDETIAEIYQSKLLQAVPATTIKAASVSNRYENMKDVPDFHSHGASTDKNASSDNRIIKSYELMQLLTGGGRS